MATVSVRSAGDLQVAVRLGEHSLLADEPPGIGDGKGPTPYDLLLAALGSCTVMTLLMYARRKHWPLEDVQVELHHDRVYVDDCDAVESNGGSLDQYTLDIRLIGDIDEEQRGRLAYIATRCPARKTLSGPARFVELVSVSRI